MKFFNLKKENNNYFEDYTAAVMFISVNHNKSNNLAFDFIDSWLNTTVTIKNWIQNPRFDFKEAEKNANLSLDLIEKIDEKRIWMYKWLVEFKVQTKLANGLMIVMETTPMYALTFAKKEILFIKDLLNSNLDDYPEHIFLNDFSVSNVNAIRQLKAKNDTQGFINPFDIHSPDYQFDYDCITLYLNYLHEFIDAHGLIDFPEQIMNEEEQYSGKNIFKELFSLSNNLIIEYRDNITFFKEKTFIDYLILSVAGCSTPLLFNKKIKAETHDALQNLATTIKSVLFDERGDILDSLIYDISQLKNLVVEAEYYQVETEFDLAKTEKFKIFSNARYVGSLDEQIVFNTAAKNNVQRKISGFIQVWLDGIDELIRKIEFLEFSKISSLFNTPASIEKKLTEDICAKIAIIKLGNKKLVSYIIGNENAGAALFYLLNVDAKPISSTKIMIEDWTNLDVYYLFSKLSDIITDKFSIAEIEKKKILYLKTGNLFYANLFYTFKVQKLPKYQEKNPNKQLIDAQLSSIFIG